MVVQLDIKKITLGLILCNTPFMYVQEYINKKGRYRNTCSLCNDVCQ